MTKHLIKDYDQVKAHLTALSKEFNNKSRDYYFAVGDLFNENVPPGTSSTGYTGQARGMSIAEYQRRLHAEIESLLTATETDISHSHLAAIRSTARLWPKSERSAKVAFGVYHILAYQKDRFSLIHDGMTATEARMVVAGRATDAQESTRLQNQRQRLKAYNRTQTLRIGINVLRGMVDHDDGTPLTEEQIALIGEAYAVLDAYAEDKGVSFYDEPLEAVAA